MYLALHGAIEGGVNHAMALQQPLALKRIGHDSDGEVATPAPRTGCRR